MSVTRRKSLQLFGGGLTSRFWTSLAQPRSSSANQQAFDRAGLLTLLGAVPPNSPALAPEQGERTDLGDVVRERITYSVETDERVPAFVLVPKQGRAPYPAVLCHHQHAGQFQVGKDGPAGLGSDVNQHYALELARRGYVTLVFDALCFNERQDPTGKLKGGDYERYQAMYRLTEGKTLQGKYVWDSRRALDYLAGRPEVDPSRMGMIGHSLGGQETLFTTAIDTRIRAAVSSCGFGSLRVLKRDHINHNYALFVPELASRGDYGAVLALVAPRARFLSRLAPTTLFFLEMVLRKVSPRHVAPMRRQAPATGSPLSSSQADTPSRQPCARRLMLGWTDGSHRDHDLPILLVLCSIAYPTLAGARTFVISSSRALPYHTRD
jgi:dienelactone hydrolase